MNLIQKRDSKAEGDRLGESDGWSYVDEFVHKMTALDFWEEMPASDMRGMDEDKQDGLAVQSSPPKATCNLNVKYL